MNETLNLTELARLLDGNGSAKIASITYRAKESGEKARHKLLFNVSYHTALARDLSVLSGKLPKLTGIAREACLELIASFTETLATGKNSRYTKEGYYAAKGKGNVQVGENNIVYVRGYSLGKTVIEPGTYKTVKSAEKTIEKNKLRSKLRSTRIREFRVTPENFVSARANGNELVIDATETNLNRLANLPPVVVATPSVAVA